MWAGPLGFQILFLTHLLDKHNSIACTALSGQCMPAGKCETKKTEYWPDSVTTVQCSLNGGCWEDSVIRIENILSNERASDLHFLNIMLLSVSLSCPYLKHTFAQPLSKSGVICLVMWREGDSWEVVSLSLSPEAVKQLQSFKSYIHLLKSCFTLTCKEIRCALLYCSSLHSNTNHGNSDNRNFGRTKLSILSISGLSVISLFPFSLSHMHAHTHTHTHTNTHKHTTFGSTHTTSHHSVEESQQINWEEI